MKNDTVMEDGVFPSICRVCHLNCPVMVTIEDGKVAHVIGDPESPVYEGYTCVKGRGLPALINDSHRILQPLKREANGELAPISSEQAIAEIAMKLRSIIDVHGPNSVAIYLGTHCYSDGPLVMPLGVAFADAIETRVRLNPGTIDQPGKLLVNSFLGRWLAPGIPFERCNAALFVGGNPMVSHLYSPKPNPRTWVSQARERQMKMIVIDPRRTELAKRAYLHIQARPGHDAAILSAMIRTIIHEGFEDSAFLDEETTGFAELRAAVEPLTPVAVARQAGVSADDIIAAAHIFATEGPGWAMAATGSSMAGSSTLIEYLLACLKTLCGYWQRAGDVVGNPGSLSPPFPAMAQALPPSPWSTGFATRTRGLTETKAGFPTAAAANEMLTEGQGQIKALISVGGNPVMAWPEQDQVVEGLRSLELLVQVDPFMSATAKLSDYVVPVTMAMEVPVLSLFYDVLDLAGGVSFDVPYAHYVPAIVAPPEGADLLDDWQFFYRLARRMGLPLRISPYLESPLSPPFDLDMAKEPTTDEMLELITAGSRVPLDEVKRFPHGKSFTEPTVVVAAKADGWDGRLDIGAPEMIDDLRQLAALSEDDDQRPFRLIPRRMMHVYNSSVHISATDRGRAYNPAFINPADLESMLLSPGEQVTVESNYGRVIAIVESDATVRPGCISMSHCFGSAPGEALDVRSTGTSVAALLSNADVIDRYSGMPRMSGIPVSVERLEH